MRSHIPSFPCCLTCQPHICRKPTKPGPQHLHTMLIDEAACHFEQTLLLVFLCEGHGAGDGIANVHGLHIVEVHLGREEANHAADVGNHAASEQTGYNAPPEEVALRESFINMIGVVISGNAAEERNIALGKCAPESEGLPDLYGIEGFAYLLLKFGCCL